MSGEKHWSEYREHDLAGLSDDELRRIADQVDRYHKVRPWLRKSPSHNEQHMLRRIPEEVRRRAHLAEGVS